MREAIKILESSGVIIFPTETVYGIGCLYNNERGIKRIYKLKKRPKSKPLQVLIATQKQLKELVKEIPKTAKELMKKHWPGPLTLIFKKKGKGTIGIRMPDHPLILKIIKKVGPLTATSANISGKKPAITAKQAIKNLPGVDYVLDGGRCKIGKASAIVDVTTEPATESRSDRDGSILRGNRDV